MAFFSDHPRGIHDKSLAPRVLRSRRTVHIPDRSLDPEFAFPGVSSLASTLLGVPLLRDDRIEGVFTLTRSNVAPFTPSQIELVESFADQSMIAIENTRLMHETREALERQTATADILKVIASSPSDVQPVFDAIAASANRLIGGFSATVMLFVGDALHLVALTGTNAAADQALQASFPRPLADFPPFKLVRGGETVEFADTEAENVPPVNRELARLRGYRSMLFTPLMSNGAAVGILSVTRVRPGTFPTHHVQLLRTFADQAVIAIENARLFNEVQAKTRDLSEALIYQTGSANILKVIASSPTDVGPVLRAIVESACELCEAYDALVRLKNGDDLEFSAHFGPIPVAAGSLPISRNWTGGLAAIERKPVHIHDLLSSEGDPFPEAQRRAREYGHRTILTVPMLREGETVGVIIIRRNEVHPFTDKQIALLQTFADQAVIAIENVRLFDEVQARTSELSQSLDDLRTAQDRLVQTEKLASLGQLTAGIAHEIKNPLNFVNNFAALSAELTDELDETLAPAPLDQKMRGEVGELTHMLKSNLEKVVQHGKRADSIVKNMLLHSREGSGERRVSDVNALVSESLNLAYHGARAERSDFNICLEQELDPDAGLVDVYPQELTRALLNLISNGFYAAVSRKMESDGNPFEPVLSAATKNAGSAVEIRIRDNGTGIPAEIREKIFNPFFTTKPTGEGTGLGLSMTHDIIVKQHGGRIDVATEPGSFTEFIITLPRANGATGNSQRQ